MFFIRALSFRCLHPIDEPPAWAEAVPRWQQIDPASYAVAEAWNLWGAIGESKETLNPDVFILANQHASNASDFRFASSGAYSPSQFVSTLPSVTLAAMLQVSGWVGEMFCFQNGARTLLTAFAEAELLLRGGSARVGIVNYALGSRSAGTGRCEAVVRYFEMRAEPRGSATQLIWRPSKGQTRSGGVDDDFINWLEAETATGVTFAAGNDREFALQAQPATSPFLQSPKTIEAIG